LGACCKYQLLGKREQVEERDKQELGFGRGWKKRMFEGARGLSSTFGRLKKGVKS